MKGLPLTVTASLKVTCTETVFVLASIAAAPNDVALGPTASTTTFGNAAEAAGLALFLAASRMVAPPESPIGPAIRTPAGAESPGWTT
ncbi:MAG: hypothetical protein EBZ59_07450, partial [Planctomycetia bacterium]|nr:hypothetical protein [Planctomycetia bacterium]